MAKPAIKILVDHSGSMYTMRKSASEAIAQYLKERRTVGDSPWVSLSEFSLRYNLVYPFRHIDDASPYTMQPTGMTALNDAIAKAVQELDEFKPNKPRDKYLVILTDGEENASQEHTKASIKALLEDRQAKGWKVIYLGANQDAIAVAAEYSIPNYASVTYRGSSGLKSAVSGSSFLTSSPVSYARGFSTEDRSKAFSDDEDIY